MDPRRFRHDINRPAPRPHQSVDGFLPPSRSLPSVKARQSAAKVVPLRPVEAVRRPGMARPIAPAAPRPVPDRTSPATTLPQRNWEAIAERSTHRRSVKWRYVLVPLACLSLVVGGFAIWHHRGSNNELVAAQSPVGLAANQTTKLATLPNTLPTANGLATYKTAVQSIFSANPNVRATVITVNLKTGQKLQLGSTNPYTAASTAKLLTAVTYFAQAQKGAVSLDTVMSNGQTAQYNLQQMIVLSDNDAWTLLNSYLTHAKLISQAKTIGMTAYDPDNNVLTADDMARLLQQLYNGTLINQTNRDMLMGWMQKANYRNYIVADVPDGYTVYHKVGVVDDLLHDVAIITKGDEALELVIYTDGGETYQTDTQANMIQGITTAALAAYFKTDTPG